MMRVGFHLLLPGAGATVPQDRPVLAWDNSHTTGAKGQGARRQEARPPPDVSAGSRADVCTVFSPYQGLDHDIRRSQRELIVHGDLDS